MPTVKNYYLRYRIIDECLNDVNVRYSRVALTKKINTKLKLYDEEDKISVHTIDKDIKAMKAYPISAPIIFDKFNDCYRYSREFSLKGFNLSDDEENVLNMSMAMLDILKDTRYAATYNAVIQRLITQANAIDKGNIIEFEQSATQPGIEIVDMLYDSIFKKEALTIKYQVYGKDVKTHIVSPYMIKEYRNRFYLIGRKHDDTKMEELIYTLGMDRIKSIKKAKVPFIPTKGFNTKTYFKHSIGITRKLFEEPIELTLKFSSFNAPYILSKPLHHSQKIVKQTKDFLTVTINVYESFELDMLVLCYGSGVEVLSPKSYKERIKDVVAEMGKIYKIK